MLRSTTPASDGILSAIGNTPLVRLERLLGETQFELYGKLEMLNPGGSIKDRTAFNILRKAFENGDLKPGSVVIESTSGNMGVGLAQACLRFGLRFICVVDPKTTDQNLRILRAYGAEINRVCEPDPNTGEYLQARINRVDQLCQSIPNSFWPNQYANTHNPGAHHQTMREIVEALDGKLDYLFCAISTCGTMRGCAEYVRKNDLKTKIIAVDAVGSVIFGGQKAKRLIPGHGAAVTPSLFQPNLAYDAIHVTDIECITGCHLLARREAILAGGSSGAVVSALLKSRKTIEPGAVCVAIFPDRGERYLDTIYSNKWVQEHFGSFEHEWEETLDVEQLATVVS